MRLAHHQSLHLLLNVADSSTNQSSQLVEIQQTNDKVKIKKVDDSQRDAERFRSKRQYYSWDKVAQYPQVLSF